MTKCAFTWTDGWAGEEDPHVCFRDGEVKHSVHLCACDARMLADSVDPTVTPSGGAEASP